MNLIANRQLDKSECQVIYELTLKKLQSKKSTMSEKHLAAKQQLARELSWLTGSMSEELAMLEQEQQEEQRKKEANITTLKTQLEHLNGELEQRLYQYEYLVEQEKALLGSRNVMLFANQGVNNFHLHDSHAAAMGAAH